MLRIGATGWLNELGDLTEPLGHDCWSNFRPASEGEMRTFELKVGRTLDPELREFYRTVGYGSFPDHIGGGFYSPSEMLACLGAPIYFITGSLSPGKEWASPEAHTRLWLSRGRENPNPSRFTDKALELEGVKLYDLLQFGSDGCCCYHQLYVGPEPAPFRSCLLTESQTMEDRSATFSEGLERIIAHQLLDNIKSD
jgi:hypothetical protein